MSVTIEHKSTTVASVFQIDISQNIACAIHNGFCKSSHINFVAQIKWSC